MGRQSLQGVREAGHPVIAASGEMRAELDALKGYLFMHVYRHERVMKVVHAAEMIVHNLFHSYMRTPDNMPDPWCAAANGATDRARAAVVADFVAGMTDRYAVKEHRRLFDATPELR